jgi:hypothetical protein
MLDSYTTPTTTCTEYRHILLTLILTTLVDMVTEGFDENLRHMLYVAQEEGRRFGESVMIRA